MTQLVLSLLSLSIPCHVLLESNKQVEYLPTKVVIPGDRGRQMVAASTPRVLLKGGLAKEMPDRFENSSPTLKPNLALLQSPNYHTFLSCRSSGPILRFYAKTPNRDGTNIDQSVHGPIDPLNRDCLH